MAAAGVVAALPPLLLLLLLLQDAFPFCISLLRRAREIF
jgi:hypothetical protein